MGGEHIGHRFGPGLDMQLLVNIVERFFDGAFGNAETQGDALIGAALDHMLEHLLLPLGQTGAGSLAEADHLGGVDQHDEGPVGAVFAVDDDQLGFEKAPGSVGTLDAELLGMVLPRADVGHDRLYRRGFGVAVQDVFHDFLENVVGPFHMQAVFVQAEQAHAVDA